MTAPTPDADRAFASNEGVIAARWPDLWRRLSEAPFAGALRWSDTPRPTLVVDDIHLTSGYDRRREAALQAQLVPSHSAEAWVYGVGAGELARVLLERPALRRLVVVPLNAGLFREACRHLDHSDWLADPRVEMRLGEDERRIGAPFAAVPGCLKLASSGAAPLRDRVLLELATPLIQAQHRAADGVGLDGMNDANYRGQAGRIAANMARVAGDGDVRELFGTRRGRTVLVAAAGPTLAQHLEWLARHRERFTLVAVDAALNSLSAAEVWPDVVVSVDPGVEITRCFELPEAAFAAMTLVYFPVVHPEALARWQGRRLAAYGRSPMYAEIARRHERGALFCSGSVVHPAADLAVAMGAGRVVLLGADFGYPGGTTHVPGSPFDAPVASAEAWIEDGHGRSIRTIPNLRGYLRDFEDYVAAQPGVAFLTASRDGARIEGAAYKPLEALDGD